MCLTIGEKEMATEKNIWESDQFRKDPYKVPDGYFVEFPDRMMARINQSVILAAGDESTHR